MAASNKGGCKIIRRYKTEVARLLGGTEQRLRDFYQVQKFVSYWKTIVYYCKIIKMTEVERLL